MPKSFGISSEGQQYLFLVSRTAYFRFMVLT